MNKSSDTFSAEDVANNFSPQDVKDTIKEVTKQLETQMKQQSLKGTTSFPNAYYEVAEPTYENPWNAPIWRQWQGRADEFWSARLQNDLAWEFEKNR